MNANSNTGNNTDTTSDTPAAPATPDAQRILETIADTMSAIARHLEAFALRTHPAKTQGNAAPTGNDADNGDTADDDTDSFGIRNSGGAVDEATDDLDDALDDLGDVMDDVMDDFDGAMDDFVDLMDDFIERADTTRSKRVKTPAQEWPWGGTWTTQTIVAVTKPAEPVQTCDDADATKDDRATGENGATDEGAGAANEDAGAGGSEPKTRRYRFGNIGRGYVELRS